MSAKKATLMIYAVIFSIGALAMLVAGCSSSSDNEISSDKALRIQSVTASPSLAGTGETSVIEVVVTDGTNPVSNRVVMFSVNSQYGYCTPDIDTTDENGVAASVLTCTAEGNAVITVRLTDEIYRTVTVQINSNSQNQGSGNVTLAATPSIVLADGITTAEITITLRDGDSQLAPDGTTIRLAAGEKFYDADANGYFSQGVDSLIYDEIQNGSWDPIGIIPSTVTVSGGAGQATANYIAGTQTATVYIKATVDDNGIQGDAETTIRLTPDAAIASIVLTSDSIHLAVKQTGGLETAMLHAIGYDANANRVPEGLPISFIITDGPDTSAAGEHLGSLTGAAKRGPYVAVTNALGIASCPISSGTVSGTIRIRAYADTILSNATQIMVHAGPPYRIVVASEECNVPYWNWVNKTVDVTALVSDYWNNPCPDSTVVYFTCDEGVIKAHEARIQGENGLAKSTWMSYGADPSADGIVVIIAETNGGTLVDSNTFVNSWIPANIWFDTYPSSMYANGYSDGFMYVEVRDVNGNFVNDLSVIKFESEFVEFEDREDGDGCYTSGISNHAQSVILDQDYSLNGIADNGIGAVDYLTARYGVLASATAPCTLLTGMAYRDNCELEIDNTAADYGETVYFSVTIKDRWGNPLGDHTLVASADNGATVPSGTRLTDQYGKAEDYRVIMPPASSGASKVNLTVQDIDPRGGLTLTQTIEIPVNPVLNAAPSALSFGSALNSLSFNITNIGTGKITWSISTDQTWLDVDTYSGTTITEIDQIQVTVDRTGLASGDYNGSVIVSSDAGNAIVSVTMTVP